MDIPEALDNTPLKPVEVRAGASGAVNSSFKVLGEFQLRVRKIDNNTIELGYFRLGGTESKISVSASAGVSVASGDTDLTTSVLKAISADPKLDTDELLKAGLSPERIAGIAGAVGAGINRKLEVSLAAELSALQSGSAAFLYSIDLRKLTKANDNEAGRAAVRDALDGDLTGLIPEKGQQLPTGITLRRSVIENLRAATTTLKINLFGIFNFISLTKLISQGVVVYDYETGELTVTDRVTAKRLDISPWPPRRCAAPRWRTSSSPPPTEAPSSPLAPPRSTPPIPILSFTPAPTGGP